MEEIPTRRTTPEQSQKKPNKWSLKIHKVSGIPYGIPIGIELAGLPIELRPVSEPQAQEASTCTECGPFEFESDELKDPIGGSEKEKQRAASTKPQTVGKKVSPAAFLALIKDQPL